MSFVDHVRNPNVQHDGLQLPKDHWKALEMIALRKHNVHVAVFVGNGSVVAV
jgi:hypothetical protein